MTTTSKVCPGSMFRDTQGDPISLRFSWKVLWVVLRAHYKDAALFLCTPMLLIPNDLGDPDLDAGSLDVFVPRPDGYTATGILHEEHCDGLIHCGAMVWIHTEDLLSSRFESVGQLEAQWVEAAKQRLVQILENKIQPSEWSADQDPEYRTRIMDLGIYAMQLSRDLREE